ncbi:phytanoyl-CoA dioxygenase family protein [Streptomyces vastus]|uniref:phytanoyl-CoA dioxygenase family protein n=1 Tax=Streptomyces vastus TaxID=285451 RepID=UPI003CD0ADB6
MCTCICRPSSCRQGQNIGIPDPRLLSLEEFMQPLPEVGPDEIVETAPLLRAGECTFHHSRLWHCSLPNTSPTPRIAIVQRYVPDTNAPPKTACPDMAVPPGHGGGGKSGET